jgi:hypothetical protein
MTVGAAASTRARSRAALGAWVRSRGVALALAGARDYVREVDQMLYLNLALAHARGLDKKTEHARGLVRQLGRHLADSCALTSDHAGILTYERALNRDLDLAILLAGQLRAALAAADASPLAIRLNRRLNGSLARARRKYIGLSPENEENAKAGAEGSVAPSASRTLAAAARLLPARDRPRYLAEYHSELWDMATAGAGFRQQCLYASHQLARASSLRGALLDARRRDVPR